MGINFDQSYIMQESHFRIQDKKTVKKEHSDWTRNTVHVAIVVHPAEGTTSPYPQPDAEEILSLSTCIIFSCKSQCKMKIRLKLKGG
ncbi:hypothetical protein EZV62_022391 [Acer yangbiense]|uniref:Uncharacterized protein n=1 Tax=Acer yangbiense TaxID=1000413 RepID=A0A5C7H9I8_9ROSI|nr:hypothetical protein EZV62_022391 [Acer yangbiense]